MSKAVRVPVIISSPHSGKLYPSSLLNNLAVPVAQLRRLEDGRVDRLLEGVIELGAPVLSARFARAYVDPNRDADEFDPGLFLDPLPGWANTRSLKARVGLGTIPSRLGGKDIYRLPLPFAEAERRLRVAYWPYHTVLQCLLAHTRARFGVALLLDCHSMPRVSANGGGEEGPVDFALGDRFGRSASTQIVGCAEQMLRARGYRVARNKPYAGGHITAHYGRPEKGMHALQIEVRRDLFMDEATHRTCDAFAQLQQTFVELVGVLAERICDRPDLPEAPVAAASP